MFCARLLNNSLNHICKRRTLTLIHDDHVQSFQNILEITNDFNEKTIHLKN